MATSIQELEQYRANPRVQQMLTLISRTEGTFGAKDPYAVYGGNINNQLSSLARHPGQGGSWSFRWNDGRKGTATASGRYMEWSRAAVRLLGLRASQSRLGGYCVDEGRWRAERCGKW